MEASFEVKKGDKVFKLYCDSQASWGDLLSAIIDMRVYVTQKMLDSEPKQEPEAIEPTAIEV